MTLSASGRNDAGITILNTFAGLSFLEVFDSFGPDNPSALLRSLQPVSHIYTER